MESQGDYEEVIQEASELGKYASSADVQRSFQKFKASENKNETKRETVKEDTPTMDNSKSHPWSRLTNYLFGFLIPSRSQVVVHLYEKYLKIFPDNPKIVENLVVLKTIENENCSILMPIMRKFKWTDVFANYQLSIFIPLIVAGHTVFYAINGTWNVPPCIKALNTAQKLVLEVKKCWCHLVEVHTAHLHYPHLADDIKSIMGALQKCLVIICMEFVKEIELMPEALEEKIFLKDRSFNGRQISCCDLLNERTSAETMTFTVIQNLTEFVFEQVLDYSFRLSVLYCWSENDESITYQPPDLDTLDNEINEILQLAFWDRWQAAVEREVDAQLCLEKKREEIIQKFTTKPKLMRMTRIFQDSLTTTVMILQDIERIVDCDKDYIKKTELLKLEVRLQKELTTIQNLGLMELQLLYSLTSDLGTPESRIMYHSQADPIIVNPDGSSNLYESTSYPISRETTSSFTFETESADTPHNLGSDLQREDEVFEIVSTDANPRDQSQEVDGNVVDKRTVQAMKTVLNDLQEKLKETREASRVREREAYFRNYGKYPDEQDEPPLPPPFPDLSSINDSDSRDENGGTDEYSNSSGEDGVIEEGADDGFHSRASLANFLEARLSQAPMTAHGIIPIQKPDSKNSSSHSSWAEDE